MTETISKYKDSNSEWIGKIPVEWNMATVRNGYEITLGKMVQPEPKGSGDRLVPYLKAMNVQDGYIKTEKIEEMYANRNELEVYKISKRDLLVCEGGEVARSAIVEGEYDGYVFQNSIHRVKTKKDNSIEYLHYLLIALRNSGFINILVNKATIAHFTKDKFNSLKIPLPPAEEQKEIVLYVATKEKEISRLINQKHRLIALLEEKRQSMITDAITKGLNPNKKMKDSAVEWIGVIPEHWKINKIKYVAELLNGDRGENYPSGNDFVDKGFPFISSFELNGDEIDYSISSFITEERYNLLRGIKIKKDDIIYCLRGSVGKNARATRDGGTVASSLMGIRPRKNKIDPKFLSYLLNSKIEVFNRKYLTTGSVAANLSAEDVGSYLIICPPVFEQKEIIMALDEEVGNIDINISFIQKQIQKLKEYRQSLIYEAVTGKIDVREMVAEK